MKRIVALTSRDKNRFKAIVAPFLAVFRLGEHELELLAIGDVLAAIYEAGDFATVDEWIQKCAEAGVESTLQPDKVHDGVPGLVYKMRVEIDGKTRKRRSKASAVSSDFTVAGVEARIEQMQQQSRMQAYAVSEERAREIAEERKRELERREERVQREMEQAQARHAVPDVVQRFEEAWDDEHFMDFGADDVAFAAEMVRERVDGAREAGADASVCNALLRECDDVMTGEMPRKRRNAPHVDVSDDMAKSVSRDAHAELSLVSKRYRYAIRDQTAAQEALDRLREREAKAAEAEAKYDNAKGFVGHAVRYAALFVRWFRVGMARYDLMRELGADGGVPPAGDEFGDMRDMVADGIAQMEHQARFRDLAGVDVIDDVQLFRVDKELDELA